MGTPSGLGGGTGQRGGPGVGGDEAEAHIHDIAGDGRPYYVDISVDDDHLCGNRRVSRLTSESRDDGRAEWPEPAGERVTGVARRRGFGQVDLHIHDVADTA